jgi:hypothetical protein
MMFLLLMLLAAALVMLIQVGSQVHCTVHGGTHDLFLLFFDESLLFSFELSDKFLLTQEVLTLEGLSSKLLLIVFVRNEAIERRVGDLVVALRLIVHLLEGGVKVVEKHEDLPEGQLYTVLFHHLMELGGIDPLLN